MSFLVKSRIRNLLINKNAAIAHDLLMVPVAWILAYWLRFNLGNISADYLHQALVSLTVVVPIQAVVFWAVGLYRGVWRFASIPDLARILKSTFLGTVLSILVLFIFFRLEDVPRSVPILYGMLLVMLLGGPRLLYRWHKDRELLGEHKGQRVLIVGAGQAGEMLVRDMLRDRDGFRPVAFVDDNPRRKGREVHGIPVVGPCSSIPEQAGLLDIEVIVLAVPSASVAERKRLIELCEQAGVPFRTVPRLQDLMSGQVAINQLRDVSIEDLLGREPVVLDWQRIRAGLSGKTVMVTGAGGSIGSELCQQVARLGPRRLVLFENSEFNLYRIDNELRHAFPDLVLESCLGDVRDAVHVDRIFSRFRPEVVFHAAAYKHVPLLEHQVCQAVHNNVVGTRIVADAAAHHGCAQFVLISTDKAVNPANVMGATKRVAEIYCQNLNARSDTAYITVRFGNVLGSAGSVVPLFREQIAAGGPVTVTHPETERYFMTIPEATQLIMQSCVLGKGGEVFVLEMGEPVTIRYLAEQMIRLSGREPEKDIEIVFTGLRPGEKLYEELFHEQEALTPTAHEKILLAHHRQHDWEEVGRVMAEFERAVHADEEAPLLKLLAQLVPEGHFRQRRGQLRVVAQ
ncbi:MAG TPA: polysaccharide biosynthesis protein [Chromatiales bacterium]|nr:polysaccharide biosynthesis protein [Chromatiales bacterium]